MGTGLGKKGRERKEDIIEKGERTACFPGTARGRA